MNESVSEGNTYPCPVCNAPNQVDDETGGTHCICQICGWEDDGFHRGRLVNEESINGYSYNEAKRLLDRGDKLFEVYPRQRGLEQVTEAVANNNADFMAYLNTCYKGIRRDLYPAILEGTIKSNSNEAVSLCESICEENNWDIDSRIYG